MIRSAAAFVVAAILCWFVTPVVARIASACGFLDRPDGRLKNHSTPVPYLGGIAIYTSFVVGLACTGEVQSVLAVLLAGTLAVLIGVVDDLYGMSPWAKLGGQMVAVMALIKMSGTIELAYFPMWFGLGLSVIWILAVTNAFNLVDIMDGLAAGIGFVSAVILAGVALSTGRDTVAVPLAGLAGSLLGFLRHNSAPARIFMGDAGSMFVGLTLGALALNVGAAVHSDWGFLAPVMILGLPLADMAFVVAVRTAGGRSVMRGSPDHLALRLRGRGLTTRQTVWVCYATAALFGAVGVSLLLVNRATAMALVATVLLALCAVLRRIAEPIRSEP